MAEVEIAVEITRMEHDAILYLTGKAFAENKEYLHHAGLALIPKYGQAELEAFVEALVVEEKIKAVHNSSRRLTTSQRSVTVRPKMTLEDYSRYPERAGK